MKMINYLFNKLKNNEKKKRSSNSKIDNSEEEEYTATMDEKIGNLSITQKNGVEIKVCPKCLSPTLVPASNISGWMTSESYRCTNSDCNYYGPFYLAVEPDNIEDLKKIKEERSNLE